MSKLILIVEDSPTDLLIAKTVCADAGYEVVTTDQGEEALKIAEEKQPDLILLDVILPNENGFQICRAIKKNPATENIKVILVTSKSGESDKFWGKKQGADEYVPKPYAENELLEAIQKLI